MTRRPARLAVLLVSALLLGGCFSESSGRNDPTDQSLLVGQTCADLVVIGARGSTQDPDLNFGVGTEVRLTVEQLARRLHRRSDTTLRIEAIRYDSSETATLEAYQANVARGARMMTRRLEKLEQRCPDSRFALVGFSQGAQVVHAASVDVSASVARRVPLVAMIADPRHNPSDDIVQWSYAAAPVKGNGRLGSGTPIDRDLQQSAIALCVEGDEICNDQGAPGGPPSATHKHFYEQESSARATARQLDRILARNGV